MKTTKNINRIVVITENKYGFLIESVYDYKGNLIYNTDVNKK